MKYTVEGLNNLSFEINNFVKEVGFDNNDVPLRIALIHSEISEAFEAYRKDKIAKVVNFFDEIGNGVVRKTAFENNIKDSFQDEIADSVIRILDLCANQRIDIEFYITEKMKYNATRGYKFGGKKF